MKLRQLKLTDAPYMLEWMHDKSVVEYMKADFSSKTIDDCKNFIHKAEIDKNNIHFAIADDNDEYMGTVSLKDIDDISAEFAITVRSCAMGKGYSRYGMSEIIKYAFDKLNLKYVYWYVKPDNQRAVRFYDKNGYKRVDNIKEYVDSIDNPDSNFIWYIVINSSY